MNPAARMPGTVADEAFLVNSDEDETLFLYNVQVQSVSSAETEEPAVEIRVPTHPITQWFADHRETEFGALAVTGSRCTILGLVFESRDTVILDVATQASSPGPKLREPKLCPVMLPVGDDTVIVIDTILRSGDCCCFEALRRLSGGRWCADPLPNPPLGSLEADGGSVAVGAYFAMGARAWISARVSKLTTSDGIGTFSLDTERRTWRKEGDWAVPLHERALFVPELHAVIGFGSNLDVKFSSNFFKLGRRRCHHLCAVGVEARPPVVRHVWEFTVEESEQVLAGETLSLAYLSNGRFCISMSVTVDLSDKGTSFTVVDVTRSPDGELQLARRDRVHTHVWPCRHYGYADFL